eukprot:scaffold129117_cov63-Attheya_sp.AAC.3
MSLTLTLYHWRASLTNTTQQTSAVRAIRHLESESNSFQTHGIRRPRVGNSKKVCALDESFTRETLKEERPSKKNDLRLYHPVGIVYTILEGIGEMTKKNSNASS